MTRICAWCGRVLEAGGGDITHGICPYCLEGLRDELNAIKEAERWSDPA